MATITTFYPCDQVADDFCTLCNYVQNPGSACEATDAANSQSKERSCSKYCNVECNSSCNEPQTLCATGHQYIKDHEDVGTYPGEQIQKDDIIKDKWTTEFWNTMIDKMDTAEKVGKLSMQGEGVSITEVASGQPITAKLYNDLRSKICNFNVSYNEVKQNDLITAAVANAIKTAYEGAMFNDTVCDTCNTDQSVHAGCGCNCSCSCSCNCGCSCPCDCDCDCDCDCNCDCNDSGVTPGF